MPVPPNFPDYLDKRYTVELSRAEILALSDAALCLEAAANDELAYVAERFHDDEDGLHRDIAASAMRVTRRLDAIVAPDGRRMVRELEAWADHHDNPVEPPE